MKFYTETNRGLRVEASPCEIYAGNISLRYDSEGACPIVITKTGNVIVGKEGTEHWEICDEGQQVSQARLWLGSNVLSVWNSYVSADTMRKYGEKIQKKFGLSPDKVRFMFDGYRTVDGKEESVVCEMPLSEYISMNTHKPLNDLALDLYDRQNKLQSNGYAPDPAKNGMDKKDIWRHYQMVGESKIIKISSSQLSDIICEAITNVMAEEGIHIKEKNKGKFNATKARTGKSTEELTHSKNPLTKKRAIFAQNAKNWNKNK